MQTLNEAIQYRRFELVNFEADTKDMDFVNNFINNPEALTETNIIETIILFYMVKKSTPLNEAEYQVEKIIKILTILSARNKIIRHLDVIYFLMEKFDLNENTIEEFFNIKNLNPAVFAGKILFKLLKKGSSEEELIEFFRWLNNDELKSILTLSASIKFLKENSETQNKEISVYIPFKNRVVTRERNLYNQPLNCSYLKNVKFNLQEELSQLSRYITIKQSEIKSQKRKINKQLRILNQLENDIDQENLSVEKIEKYNLDPLFKNLALIELINQRNKKFSEIYLKYRNSNEIKTNKAEDIFNKYKRNFYLLNSEEQQILLTIDPKELEEKIEFITNSSLKFIKEIDESFITIIMLDINILKQLESLLFRNKITQQFILRNASKFNNQTITKILKNINLLTTLKIDFSKLLEENEDILFELNQKLLEIYNAYGIDLKEIKINQFEILRESSLLNIIDQFIEIGLQDQINTLPNINPHICNKALKRTIITKNLDNKEINLQDTINNKAFYVSDNELDDYIGANYEIHIDEKVKELLDSSANLEILEVIPEEIEFIEDYKLNDQVYLIGENYFSRIKVLRCLSALINAGYNNYKELLHQALIYNYPKYLSIEVIENLKNLIKETPKKQLI